MFSPPVLRASSSQKYCKSTKSSQLQYSSVPICDIFHEFRVTRVSDVLVALAPLRSEGQTDHWPSNHQVRPYKCDTHSHYRCRAP
jgi:hypothetical protein